MRRNLAIWNLSFSIQGLVLHRQLGRPQLVLAGQGEGAERGGIGGQFSPGERHDQRLSRLLLAERQ